jgi:3-methyladenine DNA glycosylase AlkD
MKQVLTHIKSVLEANKNLMKAKEQQKYFKNVIETHGISAPELRKLFSTMWSEKIKEMEKKEKIDLAYELFNTNFAEEKQIGISVFQKVVKLLDKDEITKFQTLIHDHVYDWATCDCLSSKVIHEMIILNPNIVETIKTWKDVDHIWVKRAACVSFVKLARKGLYKDDILEISETVINSPESKDSIQLKNFSRICPTWKWMGFKRINN